MALNPERAVLAKVVRDALAAWPGSRRTLAKAVGVTHTHLNALVAGESVTPKVAREISRALRQHSDRLARVAAGIDRQLRDI